MSTTVLLTSALIVVGRVLDVSLGTLRMLFIVQGERLVAATLGFFEILVWVVIASRVVTSLDEPAYFIAYAAFIRKRQGRGLDPKSLRFWGLLLDLADAELDAWIAAATQTPWERRTAR